MEDINAFGKLKPIHISKLLANNPTEIGVIVNGEPLAMLTIEQFKQFNFIPDADKLKDAKIEFVTEEMQLTIGSGDYNYWGETSKRLAKLFSDEAPKEVKTSTKTIMTIAVANLTIDGLINIKTCTGMKKDLVVFMNDEIRQRTIDGFDEDLIVFKFDYVEDDVKDINCWLTLQELADKGMIELRK